MGEENRTCQPLQKIESDKYRCAQLYGKKVNICSDIPDTKMHQSNIFKALTSGTDTIDGENKFQAPFSFRNTAKLTFSANKIPEGPKDEAYYQRWILIEFANRFRGTSKEVKGIIDSLTTEPELSGLLNLALKGLKNLTDTGIFSYSKTFAEIEKEYLLNSNPSAAFMDECIVMSTDDLDSTILYATFVEWCRTRNTELVSKIGFSRKISDMGYTSHRENVTKDGNKKVTVWDNISLRERHFGQDETENGQDKKRSSCPKKTSLPTLVRLPKTVFGQDAFSFVVPGKEKSVNKCNNIETVSSEKTEDFSSATAMSETSCPRVRLIDSREYGQDENKYPVRILSEPQKQQYLLQNDENDSIKNIKDLPQMRRDSKTFESTYRRTNGIIESIEDITTYKKNQETSEGKNWLAFEGVCLKQTRKPGQSKTETRIENESFDTGKTTEKDGSSQASKESRSDLYLGPDSNLPLDRLENTKNSNQETVSVLSKTETRKEERLENSDLRYEVVLAKVPENILTEKNASETQTVTVNSEVGYSCPTPEKVK